MSFYGLATKQYWQKTWGGTLNPNVFRLLGGGHSTLSIGGGFFWHLVYRGGRPTQPLIWFIGRGGYSTPDSVYREFWFFAPGIFFFFQFYPLLSFFHLYKSSSRCFLPFLLLFVFFFRLISPPVGFFCHFSSNFLLFTPGKSSSRFFCHFYSLFSSFPPGKSSSRFFLPKITPFL